MITTLIQYGALMLLQFLLVPIVLKLAGQEVLGVYSFLLQITGWAALTDLGFGVSTSRNLAQAHGNDDHHAEFAKVFTTGRTFFLMSNVIFSLIIFIVGWQIERFISLSPSLVMQAQISLYLLAIWSIAKTPLTLFGEGLIATQNIAAYNIINTLSSFIRLGLSLVLILVGSGLIGLLSAYIIAEMITLYLQKAQYFKLFPEDQFLWGIPDEKLFKKMFAFGITFMAMSVAGKLSTSSDSIILGNTLGASAVAIYYVSQMPGTFLYQVIWKVVDNSAPALNELYHKKRTIQFYEAYMKIFRYSLLLTVPLSLGLIGFNRSFIGFWAGSDQYAGIVFTFALAFYTITQVVIHLNAIIFVALGNIKVISILTMSLSIIKVFLSYFFITKLGLKGMMITNALIDLPILFTFQYLANKNLNISVNRLFINVIIPVLKANILVVIFVYGLQIFETNINLYTFIFEVIAFTIITILGIFIFGIKKEERSYLNSLVLFFYKKVM